MAEEKKSYLDEMMKDSEKLRSELEARRLKNFRLESQLEEYFVRKVKEAGGWALKLDPVSTSGLPDRIVFYKGFTWLVELKLPKGVVSPVQQSIHKRFSVYGFKVSIVRTREDVANFITKMQEFES